MRRRNFLTISGKVALASAALLLAGCGGGAQRAPEIATPIPKAPDDMQLFLLIGQSNMAGRGFPEAGDKTTDAGLWMLTKKRTWTPARDPIHFDKSGAGVGPGHQFARALKAKQPDINIGLIPAAVGGTSLSEWKVGGKLYHNAVERAREAMKKGQLKGILWHQGEADSSPEKIASYSQQFAAMIAQLRLDLNAPDVPVILGELVYSRGRNAEFNKAIPTISAAVPHCGWVSAQGLADRGDKLHFSSASARKLGARYADKYLELEKTN